MKCPACPTVSLVMADRSGIEIDYCPDCRGVWLDRGELDKIIERATPAATVTPSAAPTRPLADMPAPPADRPRRDRDDDFDDDDRRYQHDNDHRTGGKRRKKGLLGDLFDF